MKLSLDIKIDKPAFKIQLQHDFVWEQAGVHVVFGPSGCGKSHLLRAICGLEKTKGAITFNESNWLNSKKKINTPTHLRNVALVFQDSQLFSHLNVRQNLMFAFNRSSASKDELDQCIKQLNIQHLLNHNVNNLSGGEKQRVAIARSLISKPDLLLMDEPVASLDWQSKSEILSYVQTLSQAWQLPIIYVTHSIDEVLRLADKVVLLKKDNNLATITNSGALQKVLADINNPFNQQLDASSILQGHVKHEGYQNDGLIKIQLSEQFVYVTQSIMDDGKPVRLNIHANDVSISLSHALDSSILNILNGKILDIKQQESGKCLIQLQVDGQIILSRISSYSAKRLNLKKGLNVFAQIKAVAVTQ